LNQITSLGPQAFDLRDAITARPPHIQLRHVIRYSGIERAETWIWQADRVVDGYCWGEWGHEGEWLDGGPHYWQRPCIALYTCTVKKCIGL
jgi:hypothetical protein